MTTVSPSRWSRSRPLFRRATTEMNPYVDLFVVRSQVLVRHARVLTTTVPEDPVFDRGADQIVGNLVWVIPRMPSSKYRNQIPALLRLWEFLFVSRVVKFSHPLPSDPNNSLATLALTVG